MTPHGLPLHFALMGNTTNGKYFKFGFGHGTLSSNITNRCVKGHEHYNEQYFTSGGIDFMINDNMSEGGVLSTSNDYSQMDHEVSCYMSGSMDSGGHYWQVYDNNNHGTIASGSVAAFRGYDHASAITTMYLEPTPLIEQTTCEVS